MKLKLTNPEAQVILRIDVAAEPEIDLCHAALGVRPLLRVSRVQS